MLEGIKALLNSEKALVGGTLAIAATILVIQGLMTVEHWGTYTRDIFGLYIGGKTLQGAVSLWADTKKGTTTTAEVTTSAEAQTMKVETEEKKP